MEALQEHLKLNEAKLAVLQTSVDTREPEEMYDEDGEYIPYKTDDGEVDHQKYLELLKAAN
jgi:hypothetical protein